MAEDKLPPRDAVAPLGSRSLAAGAGLAADAAMLGTPELSQIAPSRSQLFAPENKLRITLSIAAMRYVVEAKIEQIERERPNTESPGPYTPPATTPEMQFGRGRIAQVRPLSIRNLIESSLSLLASGPFLGLDTRPRKGAKLMRKQVTVRFLNETEGALRYREIDSTGTFIHNDDEGSHLGDVYIRKAVMPKNHPKQIKVTIEY